MNGRRRVAMANAKLWAAGNTLSAAMRLLREAGVDTDAITIAEKKARAGLDELSQATAWATKGDQYGVQDPGG